MKNSKLLIGSVVYGSAGIGCKLLEVKGDTLTVETPKGNRTISSSKVVKVIPPRPKAFKLGDRVQYIGSDFNLKKQYAGMLEVWEISKNPLDGYTCLKPNGRTTSWVQFEDLELNAVEVTPSMTGLEGDLWA
jgi:hypothetical protein